MSSFPVIDAAAPYICIFSATLSLVRGSADVDVYSHVSALGRISLGSLWVHWEQVIGLAPYQGNPASSPSIFYRAVIKPMIPLWKMLGEEGKPFIRRYMLIAPHSCLFRVKPHLSHFTILPLGASPSSRRIGGR